MVIFRTGGRIRREAADWLARMGAGPDAENQAAFQRWYEADPRHADAYDRMAAIWSGASRISRAPKAMLVDKKPVPLFRRPFGFALAASFVVAIALATMVLLGSPWRGGSKGPSEQAMALASTVGEVRQVDLPDGSRVILDSDSRVDVRLSSTERRLTLREGRARFIVAHETRPFIVSAASNEVVATGTIFDVSLFQGQLAVVLIEGSVEVRRPGGAPDRGTQRLSAGQKLVAGGDAPAVRQPVIQGETRWPSRMLEFEDTPLREAVALVNRYSRTQLRLGDERIGNLRVSGAYRAGDVEGFARSLVAAFGLRLETRPNGNLLLVDPRASR